MLIGDSSHGAAQAAADVADRAERTDRADWAAFTQPPTRADLLAGWLAILCRQVPGTQGALLLLASDEADTYVPAAVWPAGLADLAALAPAAEQALQQRRGVVLPPAGGSGTQAGGGSADGIAMAGSGAAAGSACLAYPIEVGGELKGAVVLHALQRADAQWQQVQRRVHWASAWLVDLFRQDSLAQQQAALGRVQLANALVATALESRGPRACATALTNALAQRLGCDRVSLGLDDGGRLRVLAMSHTAVFDARSDLVRQVAEAMDESLDLGRPLAWPATGDAALLVQAHAARAAAAGLAAVWSVPLTDQGQPIGALCFEGASAPTPEALAQLAVLGDLLGPVLVLQQGHARSAWQRAHDALRAGSQALFGPGRHGVKLLAGSAALLLAVLALVPASHRVSARTVVEGAVLRAAQAPFDGFVAESLVRAGDTVRQGQLLARLDDKALRVEQARWAAELEQQLRRLRQAQAQHDWASAGVLSAQVEQAAAQAAGVADRLQRSRLVAPFDGLVVSGDLRQLVGAPVEQGRLLFEIAPLDAFRVTLQVDERDVAALAAGQRGELALAGLPGERLRFTVRQVTPVAVAEDGRNFFRVEAQVDGGVGRLRPGMEGVGKVLVGERPLLWIWAHPLLDWLRLGWWRWLP